MASVASASRPARLLVWTAALFILGVLALRPTSPPLPDREPIEALPAQLPQPPANPTPEPAPPAPEVQRRVAQSPLTSFATPTPPVLDPSVIGQWGGLRERDGVFGFVGDRCRATFDASGVTFAFPRTSKDRPEPRLAWTFLDVRNGDRVLAQAGEVAPGETKKGEVVAYDRGAVEERYLLGPDRIEQDFLIRELPSREEPLVITGRVTTTLAPPPEGTSASKLQFFQEGSEAVAISDAVAIDAGGRRLPLDLTWSAGKLSMEVPASWLKEARLPILVDPVIGSPVTLSTLALNYAPFYETLALAYSSVRNEWLACWVENFGGTLRDLVARRVNSSGAAIGSTFTIVSSTIEDYRPSLSYAATVDRYLVTYVNANVGSPTLRGPIKGRLINGDGTFPGAAFTIAATSGYGHDQASASFDGVSQWYVVWRNEGTSGGAIQGKLVSTSGTVGGTALNPQGTWGANQSPRVAFGNGVHLVVWVASNGVVGRAMTPAGTFVQSTPNSIDSETQIADLAISAAPDRFLVLWARNSTITGGTSYLYGRLVTAATTGSLGFLVSKFTVDSGVDPAFYQWPSLCYSTARSEWLATYARNDGPIRSNRITLSGTPTAQEILVASPPNCYQPRVAWNSYTGEALMMWLAGTSTFEARVQRVQFVLPLTPPPVVTGLSISPSNSTLSLSWTALPTASRYSVLRALSSGGPFEEIALADTNTLVDDSVSNGTTYWYKVAGVNSAGTGPESQLISAVPAVQPVLVLLVAGSSSLPPADQAISNRLVTLGYSVTVRSAAASTTADATGKALVLISSTVNPADVNTKFTNVAVPVLCCESYLFPNLQMTSTTFGTHYGTTTGQTSLQMLDSTHPLCVGLSGTVVVANSSQTFTWGVPGTAAAKPVGLSGNPSRFPIFGYEPGAAMVGLNAPARRAGFFLSDTTASALNSSGWALFDAAVLWTAGAPTVPLGFVVQELNGSVYISWGPPQGAQSYILQRATSPTGPWTTIATGMSANEFTDTGLTNGATYYYRVVAQSSQGQSPASASQAATPVASSQMAIGITGPPQIRTPRSTTPPPDFWNIGQYEAVVRYIVDQTPVPNVTGVWSLVSPPPGVILSNTTNATCTVTATTPDTNLESVKYIRLRYQASAPGFISKEVTHVIELSNRIKLACILRFPSGAGQTQRPYDLFNSTESIRQQQRNNLAASLYSSTVQLLRQAGIDVYFPVDPLILNVSPTFFQPTGEVVIRRVLGVPAQEMTYLDEQVNTGTGMPMSINIYFVWQLSDLIAGDNPLGVSVARASQWGATIVISDDANADTMAHELFHAMGLRHVSAWNDISGTFNNMKMVTGTPSTSFLSSDYPLRWNLMWWGDLITRNLITDHQVNRARRNSRYYHKAFMQVE
jgi:hypothetical protein